MHPTDSNHKSAKLLTIIYESIRFDKVWYALYLQTLRTRISGYLRVKMTKRLLCNGLINNSTFNSKDFKSLCQDGVIKKQ